MTPLFYKIFAIAVAIIHIFLGFQWSAPIAFVLLVCLISDLYKSVHDTKEEVESLRIRIYDFTREKAEDSPDET